MLIDKIKKQANRFWQWVCPHKKWMIVWGRGFATFKPRKELVWFWLGGPSELMISGCGPLPADEIDDILQDFIKVYDSHDSK